MVAWIACSEAAGGGDSAANRHARQLDGVLHFREGELAHDESARWPACEQALVFEPLHGQSQRRARHAHRPHQLQLRHPLTGAQVAGEDHVSQPQDGAQHLRRGAAALARTRARPGSMRRHAATAYQGGSGSGRGVRGSICMQFSVGHTSQETFMNREKAAATGESVR
jgi:hypothetical protein